MNNISRLCCNMKLKGGFLKLINRDVTYKLRVKGIKSYFTNGIKIYVKLSFCGVLDFVIRNFGNCRSFNDWPILFECVKREFLAKILGWTKPMPKGFTLRRQGCGFIEFNPVIK
jgi:hypothetical protein